VKSGRKGRNLDAGTAPTAADAEAGPPSFVSAWSRRSRLSRFAREPFLAALLLFAALALPFGDVLFSGRSIVFTDNLNPFDDRPAPENYGPGFVPRSEWTARGLVSYPNFHDPGATWWQWEPAQAFLRRAIGKGEFPSWDPFVGFGAPSMAQMTPAFFFPPSLAVVLLGNTSLLRNLYALALLLGAGLATWRLLRRQGLSMEASLFGGAVFMLGGGLVTNVGSFIGQTLACIPLALLVTDSFLDRPTWRRAALVAIGFGAIALASFPPHLIGGFGLAALWAAGRLLFGGEGSRRERWQAALRFAAASASGVALVAFAYLPAFAAMRESPQIRPIYDVAAQQTLEPLSALHALSPFLVETGRIYLQPAGRIRPDHVLPVIGVVPILLLFCLRIPRERRQRVAVAIVSTAALLLLLKLFGIPPVQWIARLPGLRTVHFAIYFGGLLGFLAAILAAFGFDAVRGAERSPIRALPASLAAAAILVVGWKVAERIGVFGTAQEGRWKYHFVGLLAVAVATALALSLALLFPAGSRGRLLLLAVPLGIFLAEAVGNDAWPRQLRWDVWRNPPPSVETLAREAGFGRVLPIGRLPANTNSPFGIMSTDSLMTFNSVRAYRFHRNWLSSTPWIFLRDVKRIPPEPVLDAANVEWFAITSGNGLLVSEAEARGATRVYEDAGTILLRRRSAPRYFFTSKYRLLPDAEDALYALGEKSDPRELLLESTPEFPSRENSPNDPAVRIEGFGLSRVVLSVDSPRPGLVSCSESFFPGWTARVNGRDVPIRPANAAFRAVGVPAGQVRIELDYWPVGLAGGLAATGMGLLAVAAMLVAGKRETGSPAAPSANGSVNASA
jgi:hypothetical protein